jgi:hypothetical protein
MFSVSPAFQSSSEPVRRKFGSRLIGIVTVCLLPLVFDVPQWVFKNRKINQKQLFVRLSRVRG